MPMTALRHLFGIPLPHLFSLFNPEQNNCCSRAGPQTFGGGIKIRVNIFSCIRSGQMHIQTKTMRRAEIESTACAWEAQMLPLHHRREKQADSSPLQIIHPAARPKANAILMCMIGRSLSSWLCAQHRLLRRAYCTEIA